MSNTEEPIFQMESHKHKFDFIEYSVFSAVLVASLGIGIFFGCFGKKNRTNEEFLMAGRSMSVFPVTMSLLCSFVSAITLLGTPVEIYNYGTQYFFVALSFIPLSLMLAFIYVPVYFHLQLTSAYEYFEKRFNIRVRYIISIISICHLMVYMPTVVYGPSLAMEQVAGLDKFMTSGVIFLVCIIYSSIGGLKAVLWTDALQAIVMLGSLIIINIVGVNKAGGWDKVIEDAENTDRINFSNFDTNLRTRHTFWTSVIGAYFNWIHIFAATQSQIQRYNSVPTLKKARMTIFLNMFCLMSVVLLCSFTGLVLFSYYKECDPIVKSPKDANFSPDQLLPLFVMDALGEINGLPGLFVAGLISGSLSTISSALNSLAAIITEDYVKKFKPNFTSVQLGLTSKIISVTGGIVAFALIFVIASVGDVLPFSSILHGTFLGPILGAFTLGMFFPWANSMGTMIGVVIGTLASGFIGIGSIIEKNKFPNQKLHFENTCSSNSSTSTMFLENYEFEPFVNNWKEEAKDDSGLLKFFTISYLWHPCVPILSSVICGLFFSFMLASCSKQQPIQVKYLSRPVLRFWRLFMSQETMSRWVDFKEVKISSKVDTNEIGKRYGIYYNDDRLQEMNYNYGRGEVNKGFDEPQSPYEYPYTSNSNYESMVNTVLDHQQPDPEYPVPEETIDLRKLADENPMALVLMELEVKQNDILSRVRERHGKMNDNSPEDEEKDWNQNDDEDERAKTPTSPGSQNWEQDFKEIEEKYSQS